MVELNQVVSLVIPYLPAGAEILYQNDQAIVRWADLDGDGINEVFGLYRYHQRPYLFILKNPYGFYLSYFPVSKLVEKSAERVLNGIFEIRAVYLFPVAIREIGGSKWGYINPKGQIVFPPIYDHAGDFQDNDLAIISLMSKTGVINEKGYLIVKPKYDTIQPFSEGRSVVNDHEGFKVIDESGKEVTEKAYSFISPAYKEGRVEAAENDVQGNYLYGYLNKRGKVVIPMIYESTNEFKEGRAVVKEKGGHYQLIDLTGNVLHTYPYAWVGNYGQGLLSFKRSNDGLFGYIDVEGNIVMEPKFTMAGHFIDGRAIVSLEINKKELYGLINHAGQFVIKPNYNQILYLGEKRYAIGKEVDPKQACMRSIFALATDEGLIFTGFLFREIGYFQNGMLSVSDDQHTYFIDKQGNQMEHLPQVTGSGQLSFETTLIKGFIDQRLMYFSQSNELIWKQAANFPLNKQYAVVEHKYKPNYDYLVYYPEIKGMGNLNQVNKTLKEMAGVKPVPSIPLESNYTGDYEITFYEKNLLVIEITGYDYPFCAAHGMPIKKYAHINLKTGRLYQLKDLFKSGSPYVKEISDLITDQIKSNDQHSYLFPNEYHGIHSDQPFFINAAGLNIFFQPYEIAAYAAGFPTFTISFNELKEWIDVNGEFWRAFH
ncbi:WG repeat-containing protein [Neobacillus drentensis]|uniref:WG repeat-containing protein n=1 Tax=Neobacillus drentensis TaxID=220684 RepID=UPI0030004D8B